MQHGEGFEPASERGRGGPTLLRVASAAEPLGAQWLELPCIARRGGAVAEFNVRRANSQVERVFQPQISSRGDILPTRHEHRTWALDTNSVSVGRRNAFNTVAIARRIGWVDHAPRAVRTGRQRHKSRVAGLAVLLRVEYGNVQHGRGVVVKSSARSKVGQVSWRWGGGSRWTPGPRKTRTTVLAPPRGLFWTPLAICGIIARRSAAARTAGCKRIQTWKDWTIDPLLFYIGLALCLLATGRVVGLALGGWRRLRGRQHEYEADKRAFAEQVAAAALAARADKHHYLGWSGTRKLRVSAVVDETVDIKSLYLTDPDGGTLPRFEPGQYLTCHFDTAAGEKPLVRCYSLSDRPREEYYRLTVKRCPPPVDSPHAPPGRGSSRVHAMQVGELLAISAPRGGFFLDPRRRHPLVLIAGGIGVTPLVSMLAALAETNDDRDVYFFYGVRNSREHPLRDQLDELVRAYPHIHQFVAYSQPLAEDREHDDFHRRGRITVDYIRSVVPVGQFDYYLCGPGAMMEDLVEGLLAAGVPEDRILYEAFGPASIRRGAKPSHQPIASADTVAPTVRFANSDQQASWDDHCESLLELMEELGVAIDSGCRAGNCGMCAARVLEGHVATVKQPGAAAPEGYCLACISVPTSPLVLEL
jgi:uncharacterized protein